MWQRLFLISLLAAIMAFCPLAHANNDDDNHVYICAKDLETENMYHAVAYETSGSQLNYVSNTSAYDTFGNYLVVLWSEDHVSIIKITGPFSGPVAVPTYGIDESGHAWEITLYATEICP